jgi:hypothetical protein
MSSCKQGIRDAAPSQRRGKLKKATTPILYSSHAGTGGKDSARKSSIVRNVTGMCLREAYTA